MKIYEWIASDEVFWALLVLAAFAFIWNGVRRIVWENATKGIDVTIPESMPFYGARELGKFSSDLGSLQIEQQPAMRYYAEKLLRGSDIAFAIALATITAYVWFRLAVAHAPRAPGSWWSSGIVWLAPYCAAMAIAYGIADVAEDLKLASILWPKSQGHLPVEFDRAEAGKFHRAEAAEFDPVEADEFARAEAKEVDRVEAAEIDHIRAAGIDRAEAAAANMLTVLKMLTLTLSLVGFVLFILLRVLQSIAKGLSGMMPAIDVGELFRWLKKAKEARAGRPASAAEGQ